MAKEKTTGDQYHLSFGNPVGGHLSKGHYNAHKDQSLKGCSGPNSVVFDVHIPPLQHSLPENALPHVTIPGLESFSSVSVNNIMLSLSHLLYVFYPSDSMRLECLNLSLEFPIHGVQEVCFKHVLESQLSLKDTFLASKICNGRFFETSKNASVHNEFLKYAMQIYGLI